MNQFRYRFSITVLLLLTGCVGVLTPSHHVPEAYSAVVAAAAKGDLPTLERSISADPALVTEKEWDGRTLLHDAVDNSQIGAATYLLDRGADVNAVTIDGRTSLHMAAQRGDAAMITLLLGRGADIHAKDKKGWTPLDRAMKWDQPEAAAQLRHAMQPR
jgi:ankyrin repeat protein